MVMGSAGDDANTTSRTSRTLGEIITLLLSPRGKFFHSLDYRVICHVPVKVWGRTYCGSPETVPLIVLQEIVPVSEKRGAMNSVIELPLIWPDLSAVHWLGRQAQGPLLSWA